MSHSCSSLIEELIQCAGNTESLDVRLLELAITSVPARFSHALPNPLPTSPPLPAATNDSVYALSCLAQLGDRDAFILLLRLRALVRARVDPIIHLVS